MLEILVKDNVIMISFNGIINNEGNFHALQCKTEEERKQNSNNNNNNNDINLSEYVGKNNLSSLSFSLLSLQPSLPPSLQQSLPQSSSLFLFSSPPPINIKQNNEFTEFIKTLVFDQSSRSQLSSIENNNKRNIITKIKRMRFKENEDSILIEENNYNKVLKVDNYKDDKLTVQIENKIHWDDNKKDIINFFSSFRDILNKHNITNIFIIINSFLNVYYDNSLEKLKENEFRLVKYLYLLKEEFDNKIFKNVNVNSNNGMHKNVKEEFDDKINKKEILQITYKEYLQDMKKFKIRYIVIFDYR
jgi:hypothetical protein